MGKTLAEKLLRKQGAVVAAFGAPEGLLDGVRLGVSATWAIAFCRDRAALDAVWGDVRAAVAPGAVVWLCYPKRTSRLASDLYRDGGWDVVTADDWHPVTQVAVDEDWSALRFRPRAEIRVMTRRF